MTPETQDQHARVEIWFQIEKDAEGYPRTRDSEGLLCRPLNPECSECEVSSVPLYLRNVAYGDLITTKRNPAGYLEFEKVIKRGGYSIYRLFLHDSDRKAEWIAALLEFDVLMEQDRHLIAIAVPPDVDSESLITYMLDGKSRGWWGAQDGYIFGDDSPD